MIVLVSLFCRNMNIADLFAKTLSAVQSERESATAHLEQIVQNDFPNYILELSRELSNENQEIHLRAATGIALKNTLSAREDARMAEYRDRWMAVHPDLKVALKANVFNALSSSHARPATTAAQVIAAIAVIELPQNLWPDLIDKLLTNVTAQGASDVLRQSSLQCIGFICESVDPAVLESYSNRILTAVVQGVRKEEPNQSIRLAAITALINSLDFITGTFDSEPERNYIMQVVCEATTSSDNAVVAAAFECLVKIMSFFYDKMQVYMQQALFALTINGMRSSESRVSLQAIEFWSTVCDIEIDINMEYEECKDYGETPTRNNFYFARSALTEIVPVLLWLLTQQDEDADEDEWNPSMAAGTCLSLLASCVEDGIVPPVVQFVESQIRSSDWRFREAAVMAFGSILDGPSSDVLKPLVSGALPVIIEMMQDPVALVKDTSAWTLGRICDLHSSCIDLGTVLRDLIVALVTGLDDIPRVAANCAWAVQSLNQSLGDEGDTMQTCALSPFYEGTVAALMRATDRQDGSESNLRSAAYEALSAVILFAPRDCLQHVSTVTVAILGRLENSINLETQVVGQDDRAQLAELQMSLCGVIQNFTRKLGREIIPLVERILVAFFRIFQSAAKTTTTVEDVFLATGVIINTLEGDFLKYMESFAPYLYGALQNQEEHQLCGIAVGIISDLCRALGNDIMPYCNQFIDLLTRNLQSPVLLRDVKTQILSTFGDIALAIAGHFEQYLEYSMLILYSAASKTNYDPNNDDDKYYIEDLFEGVFEAYTGIVQGLNSEGKAAFLLKYVDQIFYALRRGFAVPDVDEKVVRAGVGLLGDLTSALGPEIKDKLREDWIESIFTNTKQIRTFTAPTREVLKWTRKMVKSVSV